MQFVFSYVYGKHKHYTMGVLAVVVLLSFLTYALYTEENLYRTRQSGTLGPFAQILQFGEVIEVIFLDPWHGYFEPGTPGP